MILKILGPGTILNWLKWFHGQTGADEYIFDIDNDVETDDDTDNMLNNDDNTIEHAGFCFSSVSATNCKTSWPLSLLTTFNI